MTPSQQRLRDAETAVRAAAIEVREQARRLRPLGFRALVEELEAQAINLLETAALLHEHLDPSNGA